VRRSPLFFALVLVSLASSLALASVHAIYPSSLLLRPVRPPLVFLDPGTGGVSVSLDPTRTYASVLVAASNRAQLVKNPDLYSGPDFWYCSPGTYLSCYWLPSDSGASGGVGQIYGRVPASSADYASLIQEVAMPPSAITSLTLSLTHRLARRPPASATYYVVGLWDPEAGTWAWVHYAPIAPSATYSAVSLSIPPGSVEAGETYYLAIGIYVSTWLIPGVLDYRVDSAYLYVETAEYTFSGAALAVNDTDGKRYYAKLVVRSYSLAPDLDANITLVNVDGIESTPIVVEGGVLTSSSTSAIYVPPPPPGYSSAHVDVVVAKGSASISTLRLALVYYSASGEGGARVEYAIDLAIDPPAGEPSGQSRAANSTAPELGPGQGRGARPPPLDVLRLRGLSKLRTRCCVLKVRRS